jgi:hypothetical protein
MDEPVKILYPDRTEGHFDLESGSTRALLKWRRFFETQPAPCLVIDMLVITNALDLASPND